MYHWQDPWKQTAMFIVHVIIKHTWKRQQSQPLSGPSFQILLGEATRTIGRVNSSKRLVFKLFVSKKHEAIHSSWKRMITVDLVLIKTCWRKHVVHLDVFASTLEAPKQFAKLQVSPDDTQNLQFANTSTQKKTTHIIPAMHKKNKTWNIQRGHNTCTMCTQNKNCHVICPAEKLKNPKTHY